MNRTKIALLLSFLSGCATVRPITFPSPCTDKCTVTGYEVWGSEAQIRGFAADTCPNGKSVHVTIDQHKEYGVVRCESQEAQEAPSMVVVQRPIVNKEPTAEELRAAGFVVAEPGAVESKVEPEEPAPKAATAKKSKRSRR